MPCGLPRATTSAPAFIATSEVSSSEPSSATITRTPGSAAVRAATVSPIRSASLRAATIADVSGQGTLFYRGHGGYSAANPRLEGKLANIDAHITGTVWKIEVSKGDEVDEGDTVVILESMKMEMPVEAEDAGTVAEIKCEEGQAVNEGDTLVVLE